MFERLSVYGLLFTLLTGCASTAYQAPVVALPSVWSAPEGLTVSAVSDEWWTLYRDPQLDQMVQEALQYNANLALAVARVDEARGQLGIVRADQGFSVNAGVDRGRQKTSSVGAFPLPAGVATERNIYRAQLNVAYELDLWGRFRQATAAAQADLLASEAARNTVRIALAADVVQGYFALRAFDEQVAATQRSLDTRSEWLILQQLRLKEGVISEFDYRQLEAEVAAVRAQLPTLEHERALQESALAILLGRSPQLIYEGRIGRSAEDSQQSLALYVPAGLPSELLLRRPDLIEAEQRLIAANARIASARAALFPSLALTGTLGSESNTLRDLFSGPAGIWSLFASVTQPIFAGGRLDAGVSVAQARERQALAQYQRALQVAFREVRDAIHAQQKMQQRFTAEEQRVNALRQSLHLARLRYENGVASQLDVLDAERNLLNAEQSRADALRAQRAAVADLFKALGGGWAG